jgi:hypothetical protein
MEPGIPTSFIPKRPVSTEPTVVHSNSRSIGLLSVFAIVCLLGALLSYAGVYLYEKQLEGKKSKLETSITDARDGLGTEFVADMKRLNARIDGVKYLIKEHIVVSPIFTALQETTLRSVQYEHFVYSTSTDSSGVDMVNVTITGSAKSYATIALQSDAFSKNSIIKNPVFSSLEVDDNTDRIKFKLEFNVNASDLTYEKLIAGSSQTQSPQVQ